MAETDEKCEESLLLPSDGRLVVLNLGEEGSVFVFSLEMLAHQVTDHHLREVDTLNKFVETFLVLTPHQVAKLFLKEINSRLVHQLGPFLAQFLSLSRQKFEVATTNTEQT